MLNISFLRVLALAFAIFIQLVKINRLMLPSVSHLTSLIHGLISELAGLQPGRTGCDHCPRPPHPLASAAAPSRPLCCRRESQQSCSFGKANTHQLSPLAEHSQTEAGLRAAVTLDPAPGAQRGAGFLPGLRGAGGSSAAAQRPAWCAGPRQEDSATTALRWPHSL